MGADVQVQEYEALIYSAKFGHLDIVNFLTGKGADVQAQEYGALKLSMRSRQVFIRK